MFFRIKEKELRPKRLAELKEVLNVSTHFLANIRNQTGEDKPFTEIEANSLEKLINSTLEWRSKMVAEQKATADNETPKLLSKDISEKIDALKREVNYSPKPQNPV